MARNDGALLPVAIVHVPKSRELAALLRGTGGRYEKFTSEMSGAADPLSGRNGPVTLPGRFAGAVADELAALLRRTPHGTAGREAVAGVAAQLGYQEPAAD
jgi:hypothetical protein